MRVCEDHHRANARRCCSPRDRRPAQSAIESKPVAAPEPLLLLPPDDREDRRNSASSRTCLSASSSSASLGRGLELTGCAPFPMPALQKHAHSLPSQFSAPGRESIWNQSRRIFWLAGDLKSNQEGRQDTKAVQCAREEGKAASW